MKELQNLALLVIVTVAVLFIINKVFGKEGFMNYSMDNTKDTSKVVYEHQNVDQQDVDAQRADVREQEAEAYKQLNDFEETKPEELLPKDEESTEWARVNPMGKGSLEFKNFLEAGYHLGVDTQTSSLRNANYQIRSDPTVPSVPVSIWQNSTILPSDATNRKQLEIGS